MDVYREFVGRVVEIPTKKKAIVQFQLDGKTEHATVIYNNYRVDGKRLPKKGSFDEYLQKNTQVKFLLTQPTHSQITRSKIRGPPWSIRSAWCQDFESHEKTKTLVGTPEKTNISIDSDMINTTRLSDIKEVKKADNGMAERVTELLKELETTNKCLSEAKEAASVARESTAKMEKELEAVQAQLSETQAQMKQAEVHASEMEAQKAETLEQLNKVWAQLHNNTAQNWLQSLKIHQLELEKALKTKDTLREKLSEVQAHLDEEMKEKVTAKSRLIQLESENMDFRRQLNEAKISENQVLETLQREVRQLRASNRELELSNEKLRADLETCNADQERQQARVLQLETEQRSFDKVLADVEAHSLQLRNSLQRLAECPICLEVLKHPLTICVNGHSICSSCTRDLLLGKCPTCTAALNVEPAVPIFVKDLLTALV